MSSRRANQFSWDRSFIIVNEGPEADVETKLQPAGLVAGPARQKWIRSSLGYTLQVCPMPHLELSVFQR